MSLDVDGTADSVPSQGFESLHLALPPPGRLMLILGTIVLPSPALLDAHNIVDVMTLRSGEKLHRPALQVIH